MLLVPIFSILSGQGSLVGRELAPNAAPECQAGSKGWQSGNYEVVCPLEGGCYPFIYAMALLWIAS